MSTLNDVPHPEGKKAYSVKNFCSAYSISKASYYNMKKKGTGPIETELPNGRKVILVKDADAWAEKARAKSVA